MFLRSFAVLLLAGVGAILPGQGLPWYLSDHYPARSASGVPTNTTILLREERAVIEGSIPAGIQYTLKSQAGISVALKPPVVYYTDVSVTPVSPLAASTRYTFTITPPSTRGDPYSFDFTTGAGPDTTPPQLIGFDPKSGTSGTGISGPFTVMFNKRLLSTAILSQQGIAVKANGNYTVQTGLSMTADGNGIVVRPQPQFASPDYWPPYYQVTVDPAKVLDASGNAGQGPPQSAQYTTFAASDTNGPVLSGFFPADGDSGVPLNASIRLLFTHQMNTATAAAGIVLDSDGPPVQARVNAFANGYGVELKPQNLLAENHAYQVRVTSVLLDLAGQPTIPASFQFTTGTDPDLTPAQAIDYGPPYGVPLPANVLVALRANKRIMPLAAVQYSTVGSPAANGGQIVTGLATISPDGQTFTFRPNGPGGNFSVSLLDVVDVTGTSFTNAVQSVIPGPVADHDPPVLVAVNPPDGSNGIGTGAQVSAAFSKSISGALSGDFARLSRNSQRIPAKVTLDGNLMTLAPSVPLDASTTYLLELNGVSDLAGNVMPPFSLRFTTGGGPAMGPVKLVSTTPSNGDQSVDVNASISFTFDAPLNPLAALLGFSVTDSTFGSYPVMASVSGSTLTITPLHSLFHDSVIHASVTTSDISGRYATGQIQFRTGPNPDTSAFQVTGVTPPDGALINRADRSITLTFSKPVNPASFAAGGIAVYQDGAVTNAKVERSNHDMSLVVTTTIQAGDATLVVDSRVTDIAGNTLAPFRAAYTFSPYIDDRFAATVQAMRPPSGASGVPANTSISWFLSKPVDLAAVRAALVVVADGQPVSGTFQLSAGRATLTFRPDAPFPAGATVKVFQRTFLASGFGSFTIAPADPGALRVLRYTPLNGGPANAVIEVEFSSEVSSGQGLITLQLTGFSGPGPVVATKESHPRPHVLRLTPVTALAAGSYLIVVSPKAGGGYLYLQVNAAVAAVPPTILTGPPTDATGVPTNASVRAAINVPLNPLTVSSNNVALRADGRTIPVLVYLSNAGIAATPTEALPSNAVITVTIAGLEDLYANPVPSRSWTFTTASGPDFTAPVLLESNVPVSYCPYEPCVELPANTSLVYRFDRGLDPQVTVVQNPRFNVPISFQYSLSDDQRTLTITAIPAWAKGQSYSGLLTNVTDLAGNQASGLPNGSFSAAFDTDRTPPKLLVLSPTDGMSGMPLNTEIMALFDKPVLSNSARRVRLMQGDTALPVVILQDDLRHIRLSPKAPLAARTMYTFVFEGVTDTSANPMAESVTRSFTTGDFLDSSRPAADVYAGSYSAAATNIPIRVIFNKPVSPATVDSHTILFNKASAIASSYYWIPIPAKYAISDDGLTVTLVPSDPLIPGWPYQVLIGAVRDFAGNAASSFYSTGFPAPVFTEGYGPDTTPPIAIVTPGDGTTGVPLNTRLGVVFNKAILPQPATSIFQMTRNGQPVPGTATFVNGAVSFVPDFPLAPGASYRIDIGSVMDLAQNVSAPVSSTFTMSDTSTPPYSSFQLVSSSPANGDAGVAVDSPLVMRFNRPVDPSSVAVIYFLGPFPVTGTFSTSGSTVTFTPSEPWPSAASITVVLINRFAGTVTDLVGNRLSSAFTQLYFKTATVSDPTPPQLLSISPQPGTILLPPSATFRLTFSKTITLSGGGLVLFSGNQQSSLNNTYYDANDLHTLVVTVNVPANSQLTLVGTDAIIDRTGNSVTPFSFQYPTGAGEPTDRPSVTSVTPAAGATNVAPQTAILLRFNKSMDPQTLNTGIRVTQDGESLTGRLDFLDGNRAAQFTPDKAYKAGSRIDVFVLETAADLNGLTLYQRYNAFFTVAATAPKVISVDQTSFDASVAPDARLELTFDRVLDPKTVNRDNVWLRAGRLLLAGQVVLRGDRILRFIPSAPMQPGVEHVLTVSAGVRSVDGIAARPEEFRFKAEVKEGAEVAAVDLASDRPAVHVRFTAPVDPLSLDGMRLLGRDGEEIAADAHVSVDYREVWLIPRTIRRDLDFATVELNGVSDRTGRRLKPGLHRPVSTATHSGQER